MTNDVAMFVALQGVVNGSRSGDGMRDAECNGRATAF